jgi:hsp70-interacting protein
MASEKPSRGSEVPHTLEGLLKLSVQLSGQNNDGKEGERAAPLSPEKEQVLRHVLDGMAQAHEELADNVQGQIAVIRDENAEDDQVSSALEFAADWVEDIDDAMSFHTLGGYVPTVARLKSAKPQHQWRAAEVIGNMCQNNPPCQNLAKDFKVLSTLTPLLAVDVEPLVRTKALRAISCIVRSHAELTASLADSKVALESILGCLRSDDEKLLVKALFLLRYLAEESPRARDFFMASEAPAALVSLLKPNDETSVWEHSLLLLGSLLRGSPRAISDGEAAWPLQLLPLLQQRCERWEGLSAEDRDAAAEEMDIIASLEKAIADAGVPMR